MKREIFQQYLESRIMILDGATGTELQKRGMPKGVCPELWAAENPEIIKEVQKEYIRSGSNAIYTCTFGGNRLKLEEFGLADRTVELNRRLAQISREAAGSNTFVVGDLAPTGQFIRPLGERSFEEVVTVYKEQVQGLLEGGVDFFVIETMMDIQEARAALLAVKESCDLPVCVSMTFNEDGRTLTGTDPVTALITLQSLGADAVGCNCSTGPEAMLEVVRKLKPYAKVPLIAKPNAGLPKLVDGCTQFDMDPKEFAGYVKAFAKEGVNLFGGCCGTSPAYIELARQQLEGIKPVLPQGKAVSAVTSPRKTVFLGGHRPTVIVGERINPTGKKKLQEELREGRTSEVRRFAMEQIENGAKVLDVNVGMPGISEKETMIRVVETLIPVAETPLSIDSASPEVVEAALRIYPGRALINSISGEKGKMEKLLPVAAKYGAMFVLLPLNDEGIPETAEARYKVIEEVYQKAAAYGLEKADIVVDGLVMTVSHDQKAAAETLKVIDWCSHQFGCNTIVGLSNVSFGLPERSWVNTAFLAMAVGRGLTLAIANPSSDMLMNIKAACDVLLSRDQNSKEYIERFAQKKEEEPTAAKEIKSTPSVDQTIYNAVVKGDKDNIKGAVEAVLKEGLKPGEIVDNLLIPAITKVGQLFDSGKYFLPQLIQSAEAMKKAFDFLEPMLRTEGAETRGKAGVVLATVKGDIHDIGKNIVGLMLKNYGFTVYDLGKDVSAQDILQKVRETGAEIVGLSALMTTTMVEMKEVIRLAKQEGLQCKFMVGGAVVNQKYADEIGADGYSEDAYSAVKLAENLTRK